MDTDEVTRLEELLCDPSLDDIVEMIVRPLGERRYLARSAHGSVTWRGGCGGEEAVVERTEGANPLGVDDPSALHDLRFQTGDPYPVRSTNSYPNALASVAQYFDARHAADLVALSTAGHFQGYRGNHGTLAVVQARAPFLAWGRGVAARGRVAGSTTTTSLAPTVLTLLGAEPLGDGSWGDGRPRPDALLARQDGDVCEAVLDGAVADHVVVVCFDGLNATRLAASIDAGEVPNLAAAEASGTNLRDGCIAALPTVTLANHTSLVTGVLPGYSGIPNNGWWDRDECRRVDLLDLVDTFTAMRFVTPGVETMFDAAARTRPGSFNAALFEYADGGTDFSSFAFMRKGEPPTFPGAADVSHATEWATRESETFRWMSAVDHVATTQAVALWNGSLGNPPPTVTFLNLSLTDEAGHEAGPHAPLTRAALRDGDARLGELIAAVDAAGATERTAFVVVADHGMEQAGDDTGRRLDDIVAAEGFTTRCLDQAYFYTGTSDRTV